MPIEFDTYRLPSQVETEAQWSQITMTERPRGYGGGQVRYAKQRVLWRASIVILPESAGAMIKLIYRQVGPRFAFLARCHPHYSTSDLPELNTLLTKRVSDGVWPLGIDYGDEDRAAFRRIVAPIVDEDFAVFKDGVEVDPANYDVLPGGLLEPVGSPDHGWDASDITWSGLFDVPVTLDSDESVTRALTAGLSTVSTTLTEVPFDLSDV